MKTIITLVSLSTMLACLAATAQTEQRPSGGGLAERLDRKNRLLGIFMVQTQLYRAPTYRTFKSLVNEAAGIPRQRRGGSIAGPAVQP